MIPDTGMNRRVYAKELSGRSFDAPDALLEADAVLLNHILTSAGVLLEEHTDRTIEEECQQWNRTFLGDLAVHMPHMEWSKQKLQFLIKHSIKGNLVPALTKANNEYAEYNKRVLDDITRSGLDANKWLGEGIETIHEQSRNQDKPFTLETRLWRRDFRRGYPIGNISECCVAIEPSQKDRKFKEVLLDYFLDIGIQVAHIAKIGQDEHTRIGQIYMLPLFGYIAHQGKKETPINKPILGVTAVELDKEHRADIDVVPPILNAIASSSGYMGQFGFQDALVSARFSAVEQYLARKKNSLRSIYQRLKAERSAENQRRKYARTNGSDNQDCVERIHEIDDDIAGIERIQGYFSTRANLEVGRVGYQSSGSFKGTNYLDLFGSNLENGFFDTAEHRHLVSAHHIKDGNPLLGLESRLTSLKQKYRRL